MVTSSSRLAYDDCFEILSRALEDKHGARVHCQSRGEAFHLRTRLHSARQIDRRDNIHVYDESDPLHGRSAYDTLVVRIKELDGQHYVYVEKSGGDMVIESLSEVKTNGQEPPKTPRRF